MPFNGQVQLIHSDIQTVHLCTEKIFIKQTPFMLISRFEASVEMIVPGFQTIMARRPQKFHSVRIRVYL